MPALITERLFCPQRQLPEAFLNHQNSDQGRTEEARAEIQEGLLPLPKPRGWCSLLNSQARAAAELARLDVLQPAEFRGGFWAGRGILEIQKCRLDPADPAAMYRDLQEDCCTDHPQGLGGQSCLLSPAWLGDWMESTPVLLSQRQRCAVSIPRVLPEARGCRLMCPGPIPSWKVGRLC